MIVVVGRVRTDADKRAAMIEIGQTVARASRAEAGCIGYRLYEDTETPDDFVFVEEWQDDAALQEHFRTPHIAAFMASILDAIVGAPDVRFHEVASTRDLSNVTAG
ncbi:MAG TPA: putative quinol monooxygenase [Solirubrobacteraceae bacterium]|jgi:quinol monooxygenase YgiN|nr:putative quinol monooxygenase [Solirubrobacteraceae bacterium]